MAATDSVLSDDPWEDLGPFYIMEEIPPPPLTRFQPLPGMEQEIANLRALSSFVRPLPLEEIERRSQLYREAGVLTRETLARVMARGLAPEDL